LQEHFREKPKKKSSGNVVQQECSTEVFGVLCFYHEWVVEICDLDFSRFPATAKKF